MADQADHAQEQAVVDTRISFTVIVPDGQAVPIEQHQPQEAVQGLIQLLNELPATAHHTNFHLEVAAPGSKHRVVLARDQSLEYYSEVCDGCKVYMVQDAYDTYGAEAHVRRFRQILASPPVQPPQPQAPAEETAASENEAASETEDKDEAAEDEESILNKPVKDFVSNAQRALKEASAKFDAAEWPIATSLGDSSNFSGFGSISSESFDGKMPQCIRSVNFSTHNPPTPLRRMAGDLCYFDLVTLNGQTMCVTATPAGFFVNSSNAKQFNPVPAPKDCFGKTFYDLMRHACPRFKKQYAQLMAYARRRMDAVATTARSGTDLMLNMHIALAADYRIGINPNALNACDPEHGSYCTPAGSSGYFVSRPGGIGGPMRQPWFLPEDTVTGTHTDAARALDEFAGPASASFEDTASRDWNEDLQSIAALPQTTSEEVLLRQQLLHKTYGEFVKAATNGVIAIEEGRMKPLPSSLEATDGCVYVSNNIFYTRVASEQNRNKNLAKHREVIAKRFAATADIEDLEAAVVPQSAGDAEAEALEAENAMDRTSCLSPSYDLKGVRLMNELGVEGIHAVGTCVIDYAGHRFQCQTIIAGILSAARESRVVYGSMDDGASVAADEGVAELMRKVAERLRIAERSYKTVLNDGQSAAAAVTTPDKPESDVSIVGALESKVVRGSDGRLYALDIARLTPRDPVYYDRVAERMRTAESGDAEAKDKESESEEKVAEDATPKPTPVDLDEDVYVALLRPELIQQFDTVREMRAHKLRQLLRNGQSAEGAEAEKKAGEASDDAAKSEAADDESGEEDTAAVIEQLRKLVEGTLAEGVDLEAEKLPTDEATGRRMRLTTPLALNTNVFTHFAHRLPAEIREKDEQEVREVGKFLLLSIIPECAHSLFTGSAMQSGVFDGESLTNFIHSHGINVRYLAALAYHVLHTEQLTRSNMTLNNEGTLELLETEIVARAARDVFNELLDTHESFRKAPAGITAAFLSCMLGNPVEPEAAAGKQDKRRNGHGAQAAEAQRDFTGAVQALQDLKLTPKSVWERVQARVAKKFNYHLQLWRTGGYVLASTKEGESGASSPPTWHRTARLRRTHRLPLLRRFAEKSGLQLVARDYDWSIAEPVKASDVAGFAPIVHHGMDTSTLKPTDRMLSGARERLGVGMFGKALEMANESIILILQAFNYLHPSAAEAVRLTANIYAASGHVEQAIRCQQRCTDIYAALFGEDHARTIHARVYLAQLFMAAGQYVEGAKELRRVLYWRQMLMGPQHPTVVSDLLRLAVAYQQEGHAPLAIKVFSAALALSTGSAPQAAHCLQGMATAYSLAAEFDTATACAQRCYQVCKDHFGADHESTSRAADMLRKFTQHAVEFKQEQQAAAALEAEQSTGKVSATEAPKKKAANSRRKRRGKK